MGNFKFGDISTQDLGLIIQTPPTYNFPERDVTVEHIPGRNGDLIIDNKCWKNIERTYSVGMVFRPATDFVGNAEKLVKWLTQKRGYYRLEDSYEPEVFRYAQFKNSGSMTNYYDIATAINITFDCKPQRYLKSGEKPVNFSGLVATLENPTGYPALPEIKFSNLKTENDEVLLITTKNIKANEVTSIVSLSKLPEGDVNLDSEMQTVYSIQNGDINAFISLNETEFPVLGDGYTTISVNTFTENTGVIEQYNNLINRTVVDSNICLAKYRPFDSIVSDKQKKYSLISYDLLKQKLQEVYEMKAYANYCLEKAKTYIFTSFNSLLQNKGMSFSFQGDYSAQPSWLSISGSGNEIIIKAGNLSNLADYNKNYGYFITTGTGKESDKKIIRVSSNGEICSGVKESSTVTITFYPADSNGNLDVSYTTENMPDWLDFEIEYENDHHSPKAIKFKHVSEGYYYLPKTGLFGKASWVLKHSSNPGVLATLSWSTWKKAFMPEGISTSTTVSYQYYFLPKPYDPEHNQEWLQYEDIMQDELNEDGSVKKDANGNAIQKVASKVHFRVEPLNETLTAIRLVALDTGYYRLNDEDQSSGWGSVTAEHQIDVAGSSSISVTAGQLIYYLSNVPSYEDEKDFPKDWLNPIPLKYDSNHQLTDSINPAYIDFQVKEDAWYRYTYIQNEKEKYTCWVYRTENEPLGRPTPGTDTLYPSDDPGYDQYRPHDLSFSVFQLEGYRTEFPVKEYEYSDGTNTIKNIGFIYLDSAGNEHEYPNNQPPEWLRVVIEPGKKEDYSDWVLKYYPNQTGLYKWDNNSVWLEKPASETEELVSSLGTDDTSVYYMLNIPTYPESGTIYNQCRVSVVQNQLSGNPESITIYAKVAGYYRVKNSSSWKYYNIDDEICTSKITETTTVKYLTEIENSLDNVSISITPKWWRL